MTYLATTISEDNEARKSTDSPDYLPETDQEAMAPERIVDIRRIQPFAHELVTVLYRLQGREVAATDVFALGYGEGKKTEAKRSAFLRQVGLLLDELGIERGGQERRRKYSIPNFTLAGFDGELPDVEPVVEVQAVEPPRKRTRDSREDGLDLYLDSIGRIPLLTAEQEVELAKKIEIGKEATTMLKDLYNGADSSAVEQLQMLIKEGDDAKDLFIKSNLKLVVSFANKYAWTRLPISELIQEGNLGVIRAVEKFDWRKGNKFSTYAMWWIRQSINRFVQDSMRIIRVPGHVQDFSRQVNGVINALEERLGRTPTAAEIAQELRVSEQYVTEAINHISQKTVSINTKVGYGDDELGDVLADTDSLPPDEEATKNASLTKLYEVLEKLPEIEKEVIAMRFGLFGEPCTLQEIGEKYELTRERIRQIEAKALGKLRHPSMLHLLKDLI